MSTGQQWISIHATHPEAAIKRPHVAVTYKDSFLWEKAIEGWVFFLERIYYGSRLAGWKRNRVILLKIEIRNRSSLLEIICFFTNFFPTRKEIGLLLILTTDFSPSRFCWLLFRSNRTAVYQGKDKIPVSELHE